MKHVFAIGPWLVELINPPPRESLSLLQKSARVVLVTITIVTLCVIAALALSLACFAWQRSRDFLAGVPQLRNAVIILATSLVVNVACVCTLLQLKRLDRKLVPPPPLEVELPLPARKGAANLRP